MEIGNWKFILIGLDISRGFLKNRTGVEEYSYQITCTLAKVDSQNQYILYLNGKENERLVSKLDWPENFKLKNIPQRHLWVHTRLAWSARQDKVDVLFIPSQAMPLIHSRNTVVTLHGLEYEYYPESYSWGRRLYLRFTTRYSLKHARRIIAVSENTKKDLIEMYGGDPEKIKVVYHGFKAPLELENGISSFSSHSPLDKPYILFIGRLEKRKNIERLIKAFEQVKRRGWNGQLILIGGKGFGYPEIKKAILSSLYQEDIIEKGYVTKEEKWAYLKKTSLFVFPSLYEGFGLPLLEAFAAGVPVVASSSSSIPEVGGEACLYFDPCNPEEIAKRIEQVLEDKNLRQKLVRMGSERLKNFSWEKCARETRQVLVGASLEK